MRHLAAFCFVLLALGCAKDKPKPDPDFDRYAKAAKEKLGKLDKIKVAAAATPPVSDEKLDPAAKAGRYTIIATEQFGDLGSCFKDADVCGPEWKLLKACQEDANKTALQLANEYGGTKDLKECSELKLLAVVRKVSFSKPSADMAAKTYSPGQFVGEVLVFEIDTAKYLGGFHVTAKTPESVDKVPQGHDMDRALMEFIKQGFIQGVKLKIGDSRRG